eukprot:TRINITY_DN2506_c0_g1_i2.p1 TRINITY_DN2506_c0_g1~~TRINITY_DN2506_c0_g1_i2.p1  ORF type:complete len:141 (-),score=25.44 TRINITY_DN2506_c0_g1_i2:133-555(-)
MAAERGRSGSMDDDPMTGVSRPALTASMPIGIPNSGAKRDGAKVGSYDAMSDDGGEALPSPSPSSGFPASYGKSPGTSNRCFVCKKKIGLTGFTCRCGGMYCGNHRASDKHECTFDYKTQGRDAIAKANPVVAPEKLQKI